MTHMFSKLGIATKIMLAPAIISLMLLVFGLFSYWSMTVIEAKVDELNEAGQTERSAQEVESAVHQMHSAIYRSFSLISMKQAAQAQQLMAQRLEASDELERMLDANPATRDQAYVKPFKEYIASVREAFDAAMSDPNLGVMMMQSANESYDKEVEVLQGVTAISRIQASAAHDAFNSSLGFILRTQILVLAFAVLAGLGFAYVAGRKIAKPLLEMKSKLVQVSQTGRFDQRIDVSSVDEVGLTAEAANTLLQNLQTSIAAVNTAVRGLAEGNFDKRSDVVLHGDLADMMASVNSSVDSVRDTMSGLNALMDAMSHGDFSVDIQVQAQGAYKKTADQALVTLNALRTMIGNVGEVMEAMSQGDLSVRVTAQGEGDLEALKNDVNASLEALSKAFSTIHGNARQVASAASESSHAIGQISDGAQNQTHAISQVATAVRQTSASVAEVSRSTEMASQRSRQSVQVLRTGLVKIEKMVEVVNNIAANSEKINKITAVIEGIANKTNLLSLNAAIEAARAGEHGKGFAVVADEVGKLAINSAESSKEIAQLVQQAVLDTAKAVAAVQEVSADMLVIEEGSQESDQMLVRIAQALEEQSTAVEQINANLSNVDTIARSNAAASEEITATVMELSRLADATRQQAERFKI